MREEIDMGQVPSAQDVRDKMSKRQVVDNMPEVKELKRKVHRMRLELDNCEEGSQAEKELISKIKAANQQIRDYYDRPLNLRSLLGMNEAQFRNMIAESVRSVLADYERRESDKQESLKRTVIDELRTYLYEMISGESIEFPSNDNAATVTTKLYWTPDELCILKQLYSTVEALAEKYKYNF